MPEPVTELMAKLEREATGKEKLLELPWSRINFGLGGGLGVGTLTFLAGQPGAGKSFIATIMCLQAMNDGWNWQYMPLEKDRTYALRRFLACALRRWSALKPDHAKETMRMLEDDRFAFNLMVKAGECISENPFRGVVDHEGKVKYPPVVFEEYIHQIREQCLKKDLVIVDPMTAIEFDDGSRNQYDNEKRFVRQLSRIAIEAKSRIVVVHHLRKVNGPAQIAGLDEIAGSSGVGRFTDNAIVIEFHKIARESYVIGKGGYPRQVEHEKTVTLAKCKDGPGTNWRIACDLDKTDLEWKEHGIIKNVEKGGRN